MGVCVCSWLPAAFGGMAIYAPEYLRVGYNGIELYKTFIERYLPNPQQVTCSEYVDFQVPMGNLSGLDLEQYAVQCFEPESSR